MKKILLATAVTAASLLASTANAGPPAHFRHIPQWHAPKASFTGEKLTVTAPHRIFGTHRQGGHAAMASALCP